MFWRSSQSCASRCGVSREGVADSVECGDAVGGRIQVAADAAPAGEGGEGVPVARDGLVAFRGFRAALGDVVRPVHGEVAGEREDLLFAVAQPAAA